MKEKKTAEQDSEYDGFSTSDEVSKDLLDLTLAEALFVVWYVSSVV